MDADLVIAALARFIPEAEIRHGLASGHAIDRRRVAGSHALADRVLPGEPAVEPRPDGRIRDINRGRDKDSRD